jgi:hypothetical protein|tara:strand:+ start:610 stop:795 length:186 start_codon:yes stop_codon:yes gene_type:complete
MKKKSKWQTKREQEASRNSQFDPKIHDLGRAGYGFQMKKDYKPKPDELSGKNLPFSTKNDT